MTSLDDQAYPSADGKFPSDPSEKARYEAWAEEELRRGKDVRVQVEENAERRFKLIRAGDLEPRPMDWLITGLFERDSLVTYFGDPGSAKTFLALDQSCCIATGTEYHGRAVKQGAVVYLAGEGFNGLVRRRKAWEIKHGIELADAPLFVSEMPAALTDPVNTSAVLSAIEATGDTPALVVVDTVARNFGPADENSTQDMTRFVGACDDIRTAFGCTVALVHHSGHGDKLRGRGSSVLHGAIDTAYRLTQDAGGIVLVENTKMKDGPMPEPLAFEFRTVELGFENEDGTPATSAVLHPCDVPTAPPKVTGKNQQIALDCLDTLTRQHRENIEASGREPDLARVSVADWRQACMDAGIVKRSFYNVKDSLSEKHIIEFETGGFVRRRQ